MVDRATFDRIKKKHGGYASWAVWANATDKPKSNIGDMRVLDPDQSPTLLQILRNDVILQRILQVSQSEAYAIAHTIGVSRIGRRLVRVPREAFLRWRSERVAESETDRGWMRQAFPRGY